MATLGVVADWRDVALVLAVRLALQIGGLPATTAATTGSTE